MKTFAEMVDETAAYLRSFVRDQEISTHLTRNVAVDDLTIEVADAATISRGRIEIGDELIWVDTSDRTGNTALIPPYGRGMDGTVAAGHAAGSRVVVSPLYPRKVIKNTINQVIRNIGGKLYGVQQMSIATSNTWVPGYPLPHETRNVLTVMAGGVRYGDDTVYLRDWSFDKSAPASVSSTGKCLYLFNDWVPNNTLTVTLSRDPAPLVSDSDPFSSTYLPDSAEDIPVLGAAARLLAMSDAYDIQTRAVEANTLDSKIPGNAAQQQSKYLQVLFEQRLEEERMRLLNSTNSRAIYQR